MNEENKGTEWNDGQHSPMIFFSTAASPVLPGLASAAVISSAHFLDDSITALMVQHWFQFNPAFQLMVNILPLLFGSSTQLLLFSNERSLLPPASLPSLFYAFPILRWRERKEGRKEWVATLYEDSIFSHRRARFSPLYNFFPFWYLSKIDEHR